jgi:O-antigen ligase
VWVVVSAAIAVSLLRGGFFAAGQYAFAGGVCVGIVVLARDASRGERPRLADPVLAGLLLMAAGNAVAAVAAGRTDTIAPALAVCAWPVLYVLASLPRRSPAPAAIVAAVAAASACAGLAALALRAGPDAERIAGIWRVGGTYEYPPALALACVCGLACVLGLAALGAINRSTGLVLAALFCVTVALTYDRAGAVMAAVVLLLFGRVIGGRRLILLGVAAVVLASLAALVLARPNLRQLERHIRHGTITSRSDSWSDAWRAIRRRPLLGYGPGGYARIYLRSSDTTRTGLAHDTVLEQTVEAGIAAGLGAAIVTVAGLARALPRLRTRDPVTLAWACVAAAVILSGLYDFTWSFPPLAGVGLVALARLRCNCP